MDSTEPLINPESSAWLDAFAKRRDIRKVRTALEVVNSPKKAKPPSITDLRYCLAAILLVHEAQVEVPTSWIQLDKKMYSWTKEKKDALFELNRLAAQALDHLFSHLEVTGETRQYFYQIKAELSPHAGHEAQKPKEVQPASKGNHRAIPLVFSSIFNGYRLTQHTDTQQINTTLKNIRVYEHHNRELTFNLKYCSPTTDYAEVISWCKYQPGSAVTVTVPKDSPSATLSKCIEKLHTVASLSLVLDTSQDLVNAIPDGSLIDGLTFAGASEHPFLNRRLFNKTPKVSQIRINGTIPLNTELSLFSAVRRLTVENSTIQTNFWEVVPENLHYLGIHNCAIADRLNFCHIGSLQEIALSNLSNVSSLDCFYNLHNLKNLILSGIPTLTDTSPLISLENLEYISLVFLPAITDISVLGNLSSLSTMQLTGLPRITELPKTDRLTNLRRARFEMLTNVKVYRQLAKCRSLRELVLGFISPNLEVDDLKFVLELTELERFDLRNIYIEGLAYEMTRQRGLPIPDDSAWYDLYHANSL